jgi:hypothetical protein
MSIFPSLGISALVSPSSRGDSGRLLVLVCAALLGVGAAACDLRPLAGEDLFGPGEAARSDGSTDGGASGGADRGDGGAPSPDVVPAGCTPVSCAGDQFCDELSGRCAARTGVGMLGGVVTDRCTGTQVNAKVGIAGRHQCSYRDKGSYFFSGLPLGMLRLAVALEGYELAATTVVITPGGNVADIALERAPPATCADPAPTPAACTCLDPGCE